MAVESTEKAVQTFSDTGSYPTTGDSAKRTREPWNRINGIYEKYTGKDLQEWTKERRDEI